jgi:hypothetical protein
MKERPILFNGVMVRAILDGNKTQTRRVVKPQPHFFGSMTNPNQPFKTLDFGLHCPILCPYGQPGDRLWVRETWLEADAPRQPDGHGKAIYAADYADAERPKTRWTPSIHMPRWASRITLEVTGVRVERLQDISEADAKAEGSYLGRCACMSRHADKTPMDMMFNQTGCHIHGTEFKALWKDINGADSWNANPWVWVIEFRRLP